MLNSFRRGSLKRLSRPSLACTECRQHKVRCLVSSAGTGLPCSRCARKGIACAFDKHFKRVKRPTREELQEELDRVKTEIRSKTDEVPQQISSPHQAATNNSAPDLLHQQNDSQACDTVLELEDPAPSISPSEIRCSDPKVSQQLQSRTSPRCLKEIHVTAAKIDECYRRFCLHYSHQVPIIDPYLSPNAIYEQDDFLFWAIMTIGSRRYTEDPTVFSRLSREIVALAAQRLISPMSPFSTVQGLVLLCAWPPPVVYLHQQQMHMLSAMAMQLGMQIGLHTTRSPAEFTRYHKEHSEIANTSSKKLLWQYCQIVCQGTSFCDGLPPLQHAVTDKLSEHHDISVETSIGLWVKLHEIQVSAITKLSNLANAVDDTSTELMTSVFDAEVKKLRITLQSDLDNLLFTCARLHIWSFRFAANAPSASILGLANLNIIASSLIELYWKMDKLNNFASYAAFYFVRSLGLAAVVILKLFRSQIGLPIDRNAAEKAYFRAVNLIRSHSVQSPDLNSRQADILTELWSSNIIFKDAQGQMDSLKVRVKTNLSMSCWFDCLCWWRFEKQNPAGARMEQSWSTGDVLDEIQPSFEAFSSDIFVSDEDFFAFLGDSFVV